MPPDQANEAQEWNEILDRIKALTSSQDIRITQHAHQEMVEEGISLDEVFAAISGGQILENYPSHRRGSCCLLNGTTQKARPIHIVCTTAKPMVIIITVYEPKAPKWITPIQRGR